MNGLTGMEKFSHLEDKIYLTIELVKKLRGENATLQNEIAALKLTAGGASSQAADASGKMDEMLAERDAIQLKVEAMLEALTQIDPEIAEAVGR